MLLDIPRRQRQQNGRNEAPHRHPQVPDSESAESDEQKRSHCCWDLVTRGKCDQAAPTDRNAGKLTTMSWLVVLGLHLYRNPSGPLNTLEFWFTQGQVGTIRVN